VPKLATLDLQDWIVNEVTSTGKYLSMSVNAPANTGLAHPKLVVLSHLGMDGSWEVDTRPSHRTRCILTVENHQVLGFSLATLDVVPPNIAHERLAFLGPDILSPGWHDPDTADALRSQILNNFHQATNQPIATALLDQRLVADAVEMFHFELLMLSGIMPYLMHSELTSEK